MMYENSNSSPRSGNLYLLFFHIGIRWLHLLHETRFPPSTCLAGSRTRTQPVKLDPTNDKILAEGAIYCHPPRLSRLPFPNNDWLGSTDPLTSFCPTHFLIALASFTLYFSTFIQYPLSTNLQYNSTQLVSY